MRVYLKCTSTWTNGNFYSGSEQAKFNLPPSISGQNKWKH